MLRPMQQKAASPIPDEDEATFQKLVALGLSRREFLSATAAASLLVLLDACTMGQASRAASSATIPPGSTAYEQALKLLHEAVLASPDHLVQRAADVVAAKDATKIVEFVRDRIAVVPIIENAGDPAMSRRWGTAATLRGGLGTLRDRADLLADMLNQAGFKAEVQVADRPATITAATLYKAKPAPSFKPDQGRVDLAAKLLRQAGAPAPAAEGTFNPGPDQAAAILSALPASVQTAHTRQDLLPPTLPVVVFDEGGKQRYAFAIGDLGISDNAPPRLGPRGEDDFGNVILTVSAMCNPALGSSTPRGQLVDLVHAAWPADQVFGHQVLVTFPPIQGPQAILDSGLAALPLRVPMLRLQNPSLTPDQLAKSVATGPLVTVHGDVLGTPAATTDPQGPYGTFHTLSAADRAAAIGRVQAMHASASGSSFPDVSVEFGATDASGAAVDGLDAPAFTLTENGNAVKSFALYSNAQAQPRPRVLVVYEGLPDPTPFKSDSEKQAFASSLAAAIAAQAAKTPFDVQVVRPGNEPTADGWVAPDAGKLAASFAGVEDSDDPWRSFGGAALDQRISAVVAVGDADVADSNSPHTLYYQHRLVTSGVPVYFMPVGNVKTANLQLIIALSGGTQLDIGDPATPGRVAGLIGTVASKWVGGGYRLRYTAPASGPAQRTVTVGLAGRAQPVASATYQVPPQPVPPPSFSGLYVTIQFGALTVQRRIAGVLLGSDPIEAISQDPGAEAETRATLDGITTIAFEPGTPTPAVLQDDVISSYLSVAPQFRIWGKATNDQLLKAVPNGIVRTPVLLPLLLGPSKVDPACVPGMRIAIVQERPVSATAAEMHVDLAVGLNELVPVSTDGRAVFKAAVATSVAECANEAGAVPDTAYARLAGVPVKGIAQDDFAGLNSWLGTVPAEKLLQWKELIRVYDGYHLVVPAGGAADAMWVVDRNTGVAKAVLLDSTGGGILRAECNPSPEDDMALLLADLSIMCSTPMAAGLAYYCVGINTAAAAMCVVQIFDKSADIGTPFGFIAGVAGLRGAIPPVAGFYIGVVLLLITVGSMGCFD